MAKKSSKPLKKQSFRVDSKLQFQDIAKAGAAVSFDVYELKYQGAKSKREKIGRLEVGQGSLNWYRVNAKKPTANIRWSDLDDWLTGKD